MADSTSDFKSPLNGFFTSHQGTNPNSSTSRGVVADSVFEAGSGAQSITPALITNTSTFGAATVGRGAVNLTSTKVDNTSTFGSHTLTKTYNATTTKVDNTSTFGAAVVSSTRNLTPTKVDNTSTFGSHTRTSTYTATATKFDNTSIVGGSKTDMWTTYQSDFSQAIWLKGDIFSISSDWEHTADLITAGSASGQKYIYRNVTPGSVGLNSVIDFKLKYYDNVTYGHEWFQFLYGSAGWGLNSYVNININTGAIGTQGSNITSVTIIDLGDGWKRIIVTAPSTASGVAAPVGIFVVSGSTAARAETWDPANGRIFLAKEWNAYFTPSGFIHDVSHWGQDRTLTATKYNNTSTFGSHVVSSLNTLVQTKVNNTSTFGAATITNGAINLTPTKYNNSSTFGTHTITVSQALTATLFDQNYEFLLDENGDYVLDENDDPLEVLIDRFGAATITQGAGGSQSLTPTLFTNSSTFGTAVISGLYTLVPTKVNNTSTFGTPVLTSTYNLTTTKVNNTSTFGAAVVTSVKNLTTTKVNNTSTFGTAPRIVTSKTEFFTADFSSALDTTSTWIFRSGITGSDIFTSGGRLNVVARSTYPEVYTRGLYDLTGSYIQTQMFGTFDSGNADLETYFGIYEPITFKYYIISVSGVNDLYVYGEEGSGGTYFFTGAGAYNATTHKYLRIRESGGTIYFDRSPDSITWTNFYSRATAFSVAYGRIWLGAGDASTPPPITVQFDNFNIPPQYLTTTKVNNTSTFGAATITQSSGSQDLTPTLVTNSSTFGAAVVTTGAVNLAPTKVNNTSTFGTQVLTNLNTLTPTILTNTSTFGSPTITTGTVTLTPTKVDNTSTFGSITNYINDSSNYSTSLWTRTRVNVTSDVEHIADKVATDTTSGNHQLVTASTNIITPSIGVNYYFDFKIKYIDQAWIQVYFGSAGWGLNAWRNVNIDTLTFGSGGVDLPTSNFTLTDLGNGWKRVQGYATATATGSAGFAIAFISGTGVSRAPSWAPATATSFYLQELYIYTKSGLVHDVSQWGQDQTLTPTLVTNTNTFGAATVSASYTLVPTNVTNASIVGGSYTELLANFSNFSAGTWSRSRVTATSDQDHVADIIAVTLVSGTHDLFRNNLTITSGNQYEIVLKAKYLSHPYIQLFYGNGFSATSYANFDVQTGAWGTIGAGVDSYYFIDHGDGYYTVSITATATSSTATGLLAMDLVPASTSGRQPSWLPSSTDGIYLKEFHGLESRSGFVHDVMQSGQDQTLTSTVLTNTFTFGSAVVTNLNTLVPTKVDNTSTFGSPTVSVGAAPLLPTLVTNTSTFGGHLVASGGVYASKVNNISTFGAATITTGGVTVNPTKVDNTSTFGVATIANVIAPTEVENTSTFGVATVTSSKTLTPTLVNNTSQFGAKTDKFVTTFSDLTAAAWTRTGLTASANVEDIADRLTTSGVTGAFNIYKNIAPDGIGRVYTLDIKVKYENQSWLQLLFTAAGWGLNAYVNININTGAIGTQGSNISEVIVDDLGNGWKRLRVSSPATATSSGPVGVWVVSSGTAARTESWTPGSGKTFLGREWYCYEETSNGLIADVTQWGTDQSLTSTVVNNTSTFGTPSVTIGAVNLQPTLLTNTNTFGGHLVSSGGLYSTKVDNTSTFGSPTITTVNNLTPTVLTNTSSFGSAVITTDYDLIGSLFTSTNEFGAHTVSSVGELSPTIINNISTFGSHSVTTIYALEPTSLVNITSFGTPIVGRGTINLQPTIISDIDSFGIPVIEVIVDRTLYPPTYINTTIFGTPIVRNGVRLYPISDPVNSGWVNQDNSATNLYASVNEDINTDMESTYITDTGAGTNTVRFSLSTPGVAIYNKNNHKVRYKVRKELGTFPTLTVNLYQSTVRIAQWIHADLPTTYTIYERTLTVDQAILLSGYTDLYIEFITTY